jgi:beta-galactosidase
MGAATAGFQVDMGCPTLPPAVCVDPHSDWYQFVTDASMIADPINHLSGDDPAVVGPGHWELYEQDYDLAAADGHNAFRMSLEWSRVFPTSTVGIEGHAALRDAADATNLATYEAMFEAMAARGLTPLVTIHHYTLPTWLHDGVGCHLDFEGCERRGWLDRERIVEEAAKYAGFVAREFGAYVDLWATQNEPMAVVLPGWVQPTEERTNPPSVSMEPAAAKEAFVAMIEAHARMADAVRAGDEADADGDGRPAEVGLVYAMTPVWPKDPEDPEDQEAAENVFYLWNLAFLNAVALGDLDANLDGQAEHRADLEGRLDFIGLNYKQVAVVEGTGVSFLPELSPLLTMDPFTVDLSVVDPSGIYDMIAYCQDELGAWVMVTENNGQHVPQGDQDTEIRLVVENLQWIARAIADGYDVRGYFYWAMMDNYEWNHGMRRPLGLYEVDPDDPAKERVARPMAEVYARICTAGEVPADLVEAYPID